MNIDDAIHHLTSEYPGGAEALAPRLDEDPTQFRSKANPNIDSAYFRPRQLVEMQIKTQRFHILHAMADELGFVAIAKPTLPDGCVMEAITKFSKEFSDVLRAATETIADGNFTPNDRRRVQDELLDLIAAANMLIPSLEAAGKK